MKNKIVIAAVAAGVFGCVAVAAWVFSRVDHLASGYQTRQFTIACDFDKFRQILVRKNATDAIVARSGMTLLNEKVVDVSIDTSEDDRPLLNAIRGRSKSSLAAVKEITVSLADPALDTNELVLWQYADVESDKMNIVTESKQPAGNLQHYETTLEARGEDGKTSVNLSVGLQVQVRVPRLFTSRADAKVQRAADDAIEEQASSIESFVLEHAGERLILPKL
ncbi:hypothetical protein Q31b_53060 [Novipirellula aureliae]|uniref:Uncharacterized protein n=1 Tax=Novipirellula aureliae TaxID=2527966 RepID=A0A5C6DEI3_9BACT|nr:hypothetical protein [Novipirellula aureliae]TWU35210.1 hypothetical protein Q31b_53060 [Novipirellula aureliae]